MTDNTSNLDQHELADRLNLIESMIAEGRRTTESWGWTFVLWGIAYYVAIAWAAAGHPALAWPVTMAAAGTITGVVASRREHDKPSTTLGRSMAAIWVSLGITLFLLMMSLAWSGRLDAHNSVAIVGAMLGMANCTSSIILRWKMQFACALVWWAVAVLACFASESVSGIGFLVAIFFCQIGFGLYCMFAESRMHKQGAAHA
jgi:hypothetical protein